MILLKNLSRPRDSHYDFSQIGENQESINIEWFLKTDKYLTDEENDLISRINQILTRCETDIDFQDKIREYFQIGFNDTLPRIHIQSNERAYLHFQNNVKVYNLTNFSDNANVETSEFEIYFY